MRPLRPAAPSRRAAPLLLLLAAVLAAAAGAPRDLTLTGTVTADGRPLAGANVSVDGTALGTATDDEGRFSLSGVPDDARALRVTATGYRPRVVPIAGERDLRIAMVEAPAEVAIVDDGERPLTGREFDSIGAPPPSPTAPGILSAPSSEAASVTAGRSAAVRDGVGSARPEAAPGARRADGRRMPPRRPQAGLLTAGDVDDGLNWNAFLRYVRRALDTSRQADALPDLDLDDRLVLHVTDAAGRPVAGARVRIEAEGGRRARRLVTETGTDGRLALFPAYDFGPGVRRLRVTASSPSDPTASRTTELSRLDGDRMARLALPTRRADRANALDLAFVIDVTGSMGDELGYLTREFESIVRRVEDQHPGVDLRFGLVAYRDHGDPFVVRRWDFTPSAREMQRQLASLRAGGGGDYPEAMDEALDAALDLDWRTGTAARIAFLVADAPPHAENVDATLAHVREARARGLRLYPLAASGVADEAEYVMRAAAVLTQARHLFLTDDSGVGNPHAEPRIPCYEVSSLDDLLVRVVAGELQGRRVEADAQSLVRVVGDPVAGVCDGQEALTQSDRPQRRSRRSGDLGYD